MISNYKSINTVIAKVYRDLKLQEEDRWVSMVEWAAEALLLIGAYPQFKPKQVNLTIEGYKASLPCDFYRVIQITKGTIPLQKATGSFDVSDDCADCKQNKTLNQFVYSLNDSYIFTNFNAEICMSYLAFPVDEDGFPLMPDDVSFDEAVFRYIVMKLYYPDFLSGKMNPNIYDKIENDWMQKCMQARGKANLPDTDTMEAIKRQWLRLIPDINAHAGYFNTLNTQERINIGKH